MATKDMHCPKQIGNAVTIAKVARLRGNVAELRNFSKNTMVYSTENLHINRKYTQYTVNNEK